MKSLLTYLLGTLLVVCFSCKKENDLEVINIKLSLDSVYLHVDSTMQLTATISPTNTTNPGIIWNSSDSTIATASSAGIIKGKAIGKATITATTVDGGKTATCAIIVIPSMTFATDEIPVDTAGNFDFKKVPTKNPNLLKDSTVALYLNFMREEYGGMDRIRTLNCDYLYINQNGDTIFNPYSMVFTPNAYQDHISTYDMQFRVDDYKKVDVFGDPIFDGNREFVNMDREYAVEKNILKVAQYAASDIVSYKIICIQKEEKYLKAIIIGTKRNYLLKILISRYDEATKQFIGGYNGITYENSIERITRLRKEKQIFDANITTLDLSEKKVEKVRF